MLTNTVSYTSKENLLSGIPPLPQQERRALARLAGSKWYGQPVKRGGSLVAINPEGDRQPFFGLGLYKLGKLLGPDQPFYIFQMCGVRPTDHATFIKSLAVHFIEEIKTVQPQGPYLIGGHCFAGWVAYEMAHMLEQNGDKVDLLVLVERGGKGKAYDFYKPYLKKLYNNWYQLSKLSYRERMAYATNKIKRKFDSNVNDKEPDPHAALKESGVVLNNSTDYIQESWRREQRRASAHYNPQPYSGPAALYYARWGGRKSFFCPKGGMGGLLSGQVDVHEYPGYHNSIAKEPENVQILAEDIKTRLRVAQQHSDFNACTPLTDHTQNINFAQA